MQPIAYLCFTLLSILIQFSLLDFITTNDEDDISLDDSKSAYKKNKEIFNKIKQTPHALYYQTEKNGLQEKSYLIFPFKYSNISLTESSFLSSTEIGTTVFDLLYDDNISSVDDHFTSEPPFSSTEFDNVTEITFFDKKTSTAKPDEVPKKSINNNKCDCNLLHDVCDAGCCCDDDCTKKEKYVFENCNNKSTERCIHCDKYQMYMCKDKETSGLYQSLFCIDKINLPEKPTKNKNVVYSTNTGNFYSWPKKDKNIKKPIFSKQLYVAGTIIWTITNKKLNILEIPIMQCNNYCSGTKAIKFLKNEEVKCLVKLQDLHMLNAIKSLEDTNIISPTNTTINSTVLNCSSAECVKFSLLICDDIDCLPYNKSLHEPTCSESYCTNIAVKVDYLFYCNESIITKAVIKLHVTRVSMIQQVVNQEIKINFYMTNDSIHNMVQLSGNIGYIKGLPIIASYSINNHTKDFFNNTVPKKRDITFPINRNGVCFLTNITNNILIFGQNKKMKCRLFLKRSTKIFNGTDECFRIQHQIQEVLGASKKYFISPYGNPLGIGDEKWLSMEVLNKDDIYGEYRPKSSKLLCFNIVKSISFVFAFADTGEIKQENQIINARIEGSAENVTFDVEDFSLILSIDTYFIDVSVPQMVDFPEAPHLNIHFPRDFINFSSNKSNYFQCYYFLICMSFMLCLIK